MEITIQIAELMFKDTGTVVCVYWARKQKLFLFRNENILSFALLKKQKGMKGFKASFINIILKY